MKKITMTLLSAALVLVCFTACSEPIKVEDPMDSKYEIVVDEDTLVQYIRFSRSLPADASVCAMTVRLNADGTPCTIDREDLDKYEHFSFGAANPTETAESAE